MGNIIPNHNTFTPCDTEQTEINCIHCSMKLMGCEQVCEITKHDYDASNKTVYGFFQRATSTTSYGVKVAGNYAHAGGHHGGGGGVDLTMSVSQGSWMLKFLRNGGGNGYECVSCYNKKHPKLMRNVIFECTAGILSKKDDF